MPEGTNGEGVTVEVLRSRIEALSSRRQDAYDAFQRFSGAVTILEELLAQLETQQ